MDFSKELMKKVTLRIAKRRAMLSPKQNKNPLRIPYRKRKDTTFWENREKELSLPKHSELTIECRLR